MRRVASIRAREGIASLIVALAMLLCSTSARAGGADQPAVLTLILNEVKHNEAIVVLRGKDIWVAAGDLKAARLHGLHPRSETLLGKPYVSLASVSPPLRVSFDENALTLRITAPAELLPTSVVDLRPHGPADLVHRSDASAFLNYTATLTDFTHPSAFVEAGLHMDGALFLSSVSASPELGFTRGLSQLILDERKHLQRFTLGDSFVSGGELGGGTFVGGISVSKNFDLDPYFIHQPSLGYTGSAMTPSKLDIYVNGAFTRSEQIAPGPFRVENLPVATGTGTVRYVLKDAFGHEHAVASPYSMVASQLAKGQSDYTYAFGFRRNKLGVESFDYGEPGLLGHHRMGITDKLTLGARLEATRALVSGGSTLQLLVPFGYASLSVAASGSEGGAGLAAVARYGFAVRRFGVAATVQSLSHRYATWSLDPEADRSTLEANVMTSVAAGPRFNFASQYSLVVRRDAPVQFRVGASAHIELTKALQLVIMASRTLLSNLGAPGEASAVLTYSFGGGIMGSAGTRVSGAGPEAFADVNKPVPGAIGLGWRASGVAGANPRGDAVAQFHETHSRFQASVSVDKHAPHLSLEASGALVAVEGAGVFATAPIQNGFAVIRVPGIKGVHGYLDNREVGTTDSNGNLVIPNLLSYYGNRIRIADQDLPLDYSISETEMLLSAPLRGGVVATFDARKMKFYRGRARLQNGRTTTVPAYGELAVSIGKKTITSPLGKGGEFDLEDLTPGHHRARITHEGRECVVDFEAPDGEGPVIDLGMLVCRQ